MRSLGVAVVLAGATLVACGASEGEESEAGESAVVERAPVYTDDEIDSDVVAYAETCKAELGITGPLPDLSCTDGQLGDAGWDRSRVVEIPITIDNQPVNEHTFRRALDEGCDRSHWLEPRCWTYDIIQRVNIAPDVEAVLNCRQKYESSALGVAERKARITSAETPEEKLARFKEVFEFNDLGYILRNKNTGKSCFFTSFGVQFYGGWIPAPDRRTIPSREEVWAKLPEPKPPQGYDEAQWNRGPTGHPRKPDNMFFSPATTANGGCIGCHNQGAFKHSPFVDQATAPGVGRIVPKNAGNKPYLLVGRAFQNAFRANNTFQIDGAYGNQCTDCHRMNSGGRGAQLIASWAVGQDPPWMSSWAQAWPQRAWMPPRHDKPDEASYRQEYGSDIDQILCCMRSPKAKGCSHRVIGPTANDVVLDAEGNLSGDAWLPGTAAESCE